MSHTPGEWKVGEDEPFVYALNNAGTNRFFLSVQPGWIARVGNNHPDDERTPHEELMANACMIAAAPDLLEAVRLAYAVISGESMTKQGLIDALTSCKDALAKAEGK